MFSKIIMSICALLAGCGVSAGVFAFVLVIGVIPRMIRLCKINSIILVENVMICGVIWGNLSSIMLWFQDQMAYSNIWHLCRHFCRLYRCSTRRNPAYFPYNF